MELAFVNFKHHSSENPIVGTEFCSVKKLFSNIVHYVSQDTSGKSKLIIEPSAYLRADLKIL